MTPQEIQIAVAEEMGWKCVEIPSSAYANFGSAPKPKTWWKDCESTQLPPYTTSIDAIQKACLERFKPYAHKLEFQNQLDLMAFKRCEDGITSWGLNALDWCEAFLITCKELKK
jgi:hypothetical protein